MSSLIVITPPAAEPVALTLVKSHLRVTLSSDDALLNLYIQAMRELIEAETGRSLVNKLYRQSHDRFPRIHDWQLGSGYSYRAPRYAHKWEDFRQTIKVLRAPLVNVQKITYIDTTGTLQTLFPAPATWSAKTVYDIGDQIVDTNGNLQQVTATTETEDGSDSMSGATTPSWNATPAGTTTDGDLTWTNEGAAPAGDFQVDRDSEPGRIAPLFAEVWPITQEVPNAVQAYFTSGYGNDSAASPATLKVGLMMAVGVCYENREAITADMLRMMPWYDRMVWSQRVLDWDPTK